MNLILIFLPLLTSLSILLFGRYIGYKGSIILSISSTFSSLLLSIKLLIKHIENYEIVKLSFSSLIGSTYWITSGLINSKFEIFLDKISILMVVLISIISFIVISYSTWYLNEDPHLNRFLSKLLLFSFSMYILVASSNFLFMFIGWEGVGLLSYLLINFWFTILNANKSSIKAILYNKMGDICFSLSLFLLFFYFSSFDFNYLNFLKSCHTNYLDLDLILIILFFLFFIAACAKSAQFLFHPWLGDAMAGPTPVSALLHAATMVTAGAYLLIRIQPIIEKTVISSIFGDIVKYIIIFISLLTLLFGGISSINQNDLKKIIAYSTCSQLGYMILSIALNCSNTGFYHLFIHGFFKALLFLSAGILIHSYFNEQDIRKFGSLIFFLPFSFISFLIGSLSIIAFPFFSGFYSKESCISLSLSFNIPIYIYSLMVLGTIFTSIYSFKILFYCFFYTSNSNNFIPLKSSSIEFSYLLYPIFFILYIGSIYLGFFINDLIIGAGIPGINDMSISKDIEWYPFFYKLIPLIFSLFGIMLAFISIFNINKTILNFFNRRFYLDPIINSITHYFSSFGYKITFKFIDRGILELFGPLGLFRLFFLLSSYSNIINPKYIQKSLKYDTDVDISNLSNLLVYLIMSFLLLIIFIFFTN